MSGATNRAATNGRDLFLLLLEAHGLPAPETEAAFSPRKFRADYLWRSAKVIIEQEGGLFSGAQAARLAHAAPVHILRDMEKSNLAQALGYRYFRFTPAQLARGEALELLHKVLGRG